MKVILDKNQSLEEAEELLEKSIKRKKECSSSEQYNDDALNEFHDMICARHRKVLERIEKEVKSEIERHVSSK